MNRRIKKWMMSYAVHVINSSNRLTAHNPFITGALKQFKHCTWLLFNDNSNITARFEETGSGSERRRKGETKRESDFDYPFYAFSLDKFFNMHRAVWRVWEQRKTIFDICPSTNEHIVAVDTIKIARKMLLLQQQQWHSHSTCCYLLAHASTYGQKW